MVVMKDAAIVGHVPKISSACFSSVVLITFLSSLLTSLIAAELTEADSKPFSDRNESSGWKQQTHILCVKKLVGSCFYSV